MRSFSLIGTLALLVAMAGGCGSSGGGGSTGSEVQVFLTDAPAEDLDSFVLSISRMALVSDMDTESVIYSGGAIQEDLLGLHMIQQFVASGVVGAGNYVAINLTVADISATAGGVPQTVSLEGGGSLPAQFVVVFDDPITLLPGSQAMVSLDYDVEDSVTDGGGDSIIVNSIIFADVRTKNIDLSDFEGTVESINTNDGTFEVMVTESSGSGGQEVVGTLVVRFTPNTILEGDDDTVVVGVGGISLLALGQTVEVEGPFDGSVVLAGEVEIEDAPGGAHPLEFEGLVTGTGVGTATVAILDVEKDLNGDLAGLISVDVDLTTGDFKAEVGSFPDAGDVVAGEKVEIQGDFVSGEVQPAVTGLEKTRFRGTVVSTGVNSVTVDSLLVENMTVPGLTQLTFGINTSTEITIDDVIVASPGDLAAGQTVRLKAARDADSDTWLALEIEREGDDFDGVRSDVSAIAANSFMMTADGTELGLGDPVTLTIDIRPETEILLVENSTRTVIDPTEFPGVLTALAGTARVKVEGILSDGSNLLATEVLLIP